MTSRDQNCRWSAPSSPGPSSLSRLSVVSSFSRSPARVRCVGREANRTTSLRHESRTERDSWQETALPSTSPDQSCDTPVTSEAMTGAGRVLLRLWKQAPRAIVSMSFRLATPRWVGLRQSPLVLHQPRTMMRRAVRDSYSERSRRGHERTACLP